MKRKAQIKTSFLGKYPKEKCTFVGINYKSFKKLNI